MWRRIQGTMVYLRNTESKQHFLGLQSSILTLNFFVKWLVACTEIPPGKKTEKGTLKQVWDLLLQKRSQIVTFPAQKDTNRYWSSVYKITVTK